MPDLSTERLEAYLARRFGAQAKIVSLTILHEEKAAGAGKSYGYGVPAKIVFEAAGTTRTAVLETCSSGPFGHEHMADRARLLLWDFDAYGRLPRHPQALDVGAFRRDGSLLSLADAEEFFLLVDFVEGTSYIRDIARLQSGGDITDLDIARCDALCDHLVAIHAVKRDEPSLYARKIRETVGDGECLFGIADSYPERCGTIDRARLCTIEQKAVAWRWKLKGREGRLSQVHGDFHPFNILFREGCDFTALDRSRGEWGEPADDVCSITGNYLFGALQATGSLDGPLAVLFHRFWSRYLDKSSDPGILSACGPFFAFRCVVMASPVWYPSLPDEVRDALFRFAENVLDADAFDPGNAKGFLAR